MPASDRPSGDAPENELQRRRRERQELTRLAQANVEQQAFARHREQVRLAREAPVSPNRGPAGCGALVVVPIGLLLLTVHPLPGMLLLSLGGVLYLIGSHHLERTQQQLRESELAARQHWQNRHRPASDNPDGI
ncbi:MAG: hypothetical protein VKO65_04675 [Cyanobacteriota bacterium]|nr:hypothetical protein [Cyanobacteriota bacterium]